MKRPFWVSNFFFLSYFVTHILSLFLDQFCKLFVSINSYSISHPLSFVSNPNCSYCSTTQFEASSTNNYIWYISLGLCLSQASGPECRPGSGFPKLKPTKARPNTSLAAMLTAEPPPNNTVLATADPIKIHNKHTKEYDKHTLTLVMPMPLSYQTMDQEEQ
jgi:hypothetical protein